MDFKYKIKKNKRIAILIKDDYQLELLEFYKSSTKECPTIAEIFLDESTAREWLQST